MKKTTFIGNLVAWSIVSVLCIVFLAWSASMGGEFGDNTALLALSVYARPVGAFSVAALLTTLLVRKFDLKIGARMRIAWRVLGLVPTVAFLLSPVLIPVLPHGIAAIFAVVLLASMTIPLIFLLFGLFYGLSLAGVRPDEDDE
ncbi:MAG: hypothetical protein Q4B45_09920 [Coriobacteriia bacterium]|nr:hypothetical protein [Coriobacteriia bacterium]